MRVERVDIDRYIGGKQEPHGRISYLFNERCQLSEIVTECPPIDSSTVTFRYLDDGKLYERVETEPDGETHILRFEYDYEGNVIREMYIDGENGPVHYAYHNWIKSGRVMSYEPVGEENILEPYREYFREDGQTAYIQGRGFFEKHEYDDAGHPVRVMIGRKVGGREAPEYYKITRYNEDGLTLGFTNDEGISCGFEYEYDELGNWIRREGRIEDGSVTLVEKRHINYVPGIWTGNYSLLCEEGCHLIRNDLFTIL